MLSFVKYLQVSLPGFELVLNGLRPVRWGLPWNVGHGQSARVRVELGSGAVVICKYGIMIIKINKIYNKFLNFI